MTINEAIVRHNFVTKIILKSGETSLSKDLKVKIMTMRISLGKIRKAFEEDLQEAVEQLKSERYKELAEQADRTHEEQAEFDDMVKQMQSEYDAFVAAKGQEPVEFDKKLTTDEYYEIVEVNSGETIDINGGAISAPDFLEVLYSLFVED